MKNITILLISCIFLGGCFSSKKIASKSTEVKDSLSSKTTMIDSSVNSEKKTDMENTTTTEFADYFLTDADSGSTYINPEEGETETFETGSIKITATKDGKGGIKLNYVDKPKKALGKGKTTSTTKEAIQEKTNSEFKRGEGEWTSVKSKVEKSNKDKTTKTHDYWWILWIVLVCVCVFIYFKYLR